MIHIAIVEDDKKQDHVCSIFWNNMKRKAGTNLPFIYLKTELILSMIIVVFMISF